MRVTGHFDPATSRGLFLVNWLLLAPHVLVLAPLSLAFVLVALAALVAVLVTGRHPTSLFAFQLGVLRWHWRVAFYGYGALATDRYPPFTLHEVPGYPATLDIDPPWRMHRGRALVAGWLLALPHLVVLGFFLGGSAWVIGGQDGDGQGEPWRLGGLIGVLVLFTAVVLLVTGRYPRELFALVVGLDRWVLRVVAYASLMTPDYRPFRLDQGGDEPGATPRGAVASGLPGPVPGVPSTTSPTALAPPRPAPVTALVVGLLLLLPATTLNGLGGAALALEGRRDTSGVTSTDAVAVATPTAALVSGVVELEIAGGLLRRVPAGFGELRVRAAPADGEDVFLGIARADDAEAWLDGVADDEVSRLVWRPTGGDVTCRRSAGSAPAPPPASQDIWVASTSGAGVQELTWLVADELWVLVLASPDGSPGVAASVDAGTRLPHLTAVAVPVLVVGLLLLAGSVTLVLLGAGRWGRATTGGGVRPPRGDEVPFGPVPPAVGRGASTP